MKTSCEYEKEILGSASALPPELARHAAGCEICTIALTIDEAMEHVVRSVPRKALPPPAVIWLKAELLGVGNGIEVASRPLSLAEKAAWVVTGSAWIAMALALWPRAKAWIETIDLEHVATGTIASFPLTPSLVWSFVFLIAITFTLMMQTSMQHE